MSPTYQSECGLAALIAEIDAAPLATASLAEKVLERACPRLNSCPARRAAVQQMIQAEAWVDLGLWLVGWELPDWSVHSLSCDESCWNCTIGRRGLVINWADVADYQHESVALAVIGAFVQAQLNKAQGLAQSVVAPFTRVQALMAIH